MVSVCFPCRTPFSILLLGVFPFAFGVTQLRNAPAQSDLAASLEEVCGSLNLEDNYSDAADIVMYGPPGDVSEELVSEEVGDVSEGLVTEEGSWDGINDAKPFNCKKDYMMLFTLGKTGSKTFDMSMRNICGWGTPYVTKCQQTYGRGVRPQLFYTVAKDFLGKVPKGGRVWVVSNVRNPFEHRFSAWFEDNGLNVKNVKDAIESYTANTGPSASTHGAQKSGDKACRDGDFFWKEFWKIIGVSVKEMYQGFNHHHGFGLLTRKWKHRLQLVILTLRLEDSEEWEHILKELVPGFKVINAKHVEEAGYEGIYKGFLEAFRYNRDGLECILRSLVTHFYDKWEVGKIMDEKPWFNKVDFSKLSVEAQDTYKLDWRN